MRVRTVKARNGSISYAIIRDIRKSDGKRSTEIVKNLGNHQYLAETFPHMSPMDYAKSVAQQLTLEETEGRVNIMKEYDTSQLIELNSQNGFNIGHLFIDQLFYDLKLDKLCHRLTKQSKLSFNFIDIFKTLISTRLINPGSKRNAFLQSQSYLMPPEFELHQLYRALDVIADNLDVIQSHTYQQSSQLVERQTDVLYYDCSNFYFEIQEEDSFRKYGVSKEHRPNPIVQMGLFMDASGMPLAFSLFEGNQNEVNSLKPLEKQIIKDYELSEFIVCTDAGLSSFQNKQFNSQRNRHYVTTQSIKKFAKDMKEWALKSSGWKMIGSPDAHTLYDIDEIESNMSKWRDSTDAKDTKRLNFYNNAIFYKERWEKRPQKKEEKQLGIRPFEERYVVTYSPKYRTYQSQIREKQIDRALKKLEGANPLKTRNPHSPDRLINRTSVSENGEKAKDYYTLNQEAIQDEVKYDGFYCVATDLEKDALELVAINKQRWEIEECFRILKTEFKARPVYLSRENRIRAHFTICYLALLFYRIMEQKMNHQFTIQEITRTLKDMKLTKLTHDTYLPHYTRTAITDALHEMSGFRTDTQIIDKKQLKKIKSAIKSRP